MAFPTRLGRPATTAGALLVLAACASAPLPPPEPAPPPPPAEPAPEVYTNTLKWTTASEVDNFGFDVYRGDSEEGPFERLTESPIEGAGTTDLTSAYEYVDRAIDPTRGYYYYVESISLQGVREDFTPIIFAKPKLPAEGEDADAEPAGNGA
ncbi:MAG: hypothetical protein OES32_00920 [Acidobacteriota bacterium]|nr:hypothetical protein [Acidobacteriota bacterium]MDH3522122.1 hypothetical protein [Acidobacteriota bacterium]